MATKIKTPDYLKKLIKDYGEIIRNGTEVLAQKRNYKTISVSPAIDIALGGGIREGSWLTLTGDPKSWKDNHRHADSLQLPEGGKTHYLLRCRRAS